MIIDRCGGCESKSEIFYIGGYMYCMDCLERIDQQLITDWASEVAIPEQKTSVSEHLSQMFGSSKFTFADFPKLYATYDRGGDNDGWYVIPQKNYLQRAFIQHCEKSEPLNV